MTPRAMDEEENHRMNHQLKSELSHEEKFKDVAAVIPEYQPDKKPDEEYSGLIEEKIWTPGDIGNDLECNYHYILMTQAALTFAQERDGTPHDEAMEKACSFEALLYISETFHKENFEKRNTAISLSQQKLPSEFAGHWTTADIALFEKGFRRYGKKFSIIRETFLPHKEMTQIVKFYYEWKIKNKVKFTRPSGIKGMITRNAGKRSRSEPLDVAESLSKKQRRRTD